MSSFIISNGRIVAKLSSARTSGEVVRFSSSVCNEALDANRSVNLVNAGIGKISNANKWERVYAATEEALVAREVNPGEFHVL